MFQDQQSDCNDFILLGDNLRLISNGFAVYPVGIYLDKDFQLTIQVQRSDITKYGRSDLPVLYKCISKLNSSILNDIAAEYYFNACGQAYNIIDLLAKRGFCDFSKDVQCNKRIDAHLRSNRFSVVIIDDITLECIS